MKKPLLYHVYRILGVVSLVGAVPLFLLGFAADAITAAFAGLICIGLGSLAAHVAETAQHSARMVELLERMDIRAMRAETRERAAEVARQVDSSLG